MFLHLFFSAGADGPFAENNPVVAGDVLDPVPPVESVESPEASSPPGSPAADPPVSSSAEAELVEPHSPAGSLDAEGHVLSSDGQIESADDFQEASNSGSDYIAAPKVPPKKAGRPKRPKTIYSPPVLSDSGENSASTSEYEAAMPAHEAADSGDSEDSDDDVPLVVAAGQITEGSWKSMQHLDEPDLPPETFGKPTNMAAGCTPMQCWDRIFPESLVDVMVRETNRHGIRVYAEAIRTTPSKRP